jgi:hypothetical protein
MEDRLCLTMKALTSIVFILATGGLLPSVAQAGDAEGCADLKLFPRLEGCVIVECSAKQHDAFEAGDGSGAPLDSNTNSLAYSCPVGDPQKMERDFEALLRKAGYQNIVEEKGDAASPSLTARKNSQWIHWSANSEDGAGGYSLTAASGGGEKLKAEACAQPQALAVFKQCEVVECTSKSEDSVAMRTAQKATTPLTGNLQTVTLACPSIGAPQTFSTMEAELKASGFDILFSDREHPENGWITGRAGKRWVQLASAPDGELVSYSLTMISSAEVLTAAKPEVSLVPAATPTPVSAPPPVAAPPPAAEPAPAPKPVQAEVRTPEAVQTPAPISAPTLPNPVAATIVPAAPLVAGFMPPRPILQVPIEPTHDRIYSVMGDVAINLLVDVGEDGSVTKAVLAGRVTKDVLKLEGAAIDAVSHWRFEPARQDGRIVPAVKVAVQMHFRGRPWRY